MNNKQAALIAAAARLANSPHAVPVDDTTPSMHDLVHYNMEILAELDEEYPDDVG